MEVGGTAQLLAQGTAIADSSFPEPFSILERKEEGDNGSSQSSLGQLILQVVILELEKLSNLPKITQHFIIYLNT